MGYLRSVFIISLPYLHFGNRSCHTFVLFSFVEFFPILRNDARGDRLNVVTHALVLSSTRGTKKKKNRWVRDLKNFTTTRESRLLRHLSTPRRFHTIFRSSFNENSFRRSIVLINSLCLLYILFLTS